MAASTQHYAFRDQYPDHRVVIFGSGTAGIGNADQIRIAMMQTGLSKEEATRHFWCVDIQGLLLDNMGNALRDFQVPYARPASEVKAGNMTAPRRHQPGRSRAPSPPDHADRDLDRARNVYGGNCQRHGGTHPAPDHLSSFQPDSPDGGQGQ